MIYAIAIIKDNGNIIGYRLLDSVTKKVSDELCEDIIEHINASNIEIDNLDIQDGKLIMIRMDNNICNYINKELKPIRHAILVALNRKSYTEYVVSDYEGNIIEMNLHEFKKYNNLWNMANTESPRVKTYSIDEKKADELRKQLEVYKSKERLLGINNLDIEIIGNEAIIKASHNKDIKRLVIPSFVTVIDDKAFSEHEIESLTLNRNIKYVGDRAFHMCRELKEVTMYDDCDIVLGYEVFSSCSNLRKIKIPNRLKKITDGMLSYCNKLKTLDIPSSVVEIGKDAFLKCERLEYIKFNGEIDRVGRHAFDCCESLTELDISNVKRIGSSAFSGCEKLNKIDISSVENISDYLFVDCESLVEVNVPEGVTEIENCAFMYCSSLKKVTLPKTIKQIHPKAFRENKTDFEIHIPKEIRGILDETNYNIKYY